MYLSILLLIIVALLWATNLNLITVANVNIWQLAYDNLND